MSTFPIQAVNGSIRDEKIRIEQRLLDRALRGEERARNEFVARFSRLLYQTLHSAGVARDQIDDVYQSLQVHLWSDGGRRLRLWRADSALSGYLAAIAARFARAHQRRYPRWNTMGELPTAQEPSDSSPGPEEIVLRREQVETMVLLMSQLSSRDAELLYRRHVEAQTYAEIGVSMKMTINHVGVALSRAETRLRRQFQATQTPKPH